MKPQTGGPGHLALAAPVLSWEGRASPTAQPGKARRTILGDLAHRIERPASVGLRPSLRDVAHDLEEVQGTRKVWRDPRFKRERRLPPVRPAGERPEQ